MANTLRLEIIVDDKGTPVVQKFAGETSTAMQQVSGSATGASNTLGGLKTQYFALAAAATAALGTISKAWDLAKAGAEYKEQVGLLDNLSSKYNTSADVIVESMARASGGLVSNANLMTIALKGIAQGITPEQLERLAGAAELLADAAGVSVTEALTGLTTAMETGKSKGVLPLIGTSLDLAVAFEGLESKLTLAEKAQGIYALAMIKNDELQVQQTKSVDGTADAMDRLVVTYENAKTSIGKLAAAAVGDLFASWDRLTQSGVKYNVVMGEGGRITRTLITAQTESKDILEGMVLVGNEVMTKEEALIATLKKEVAARVELGKADKEGAAIAKKAAEDKKKAEEDAQKIIYNLTMSRIKQAEEAEENSVKAFKKDQEDKAKEAEKAEKLIYDLTLSRILQSEKKEAESLDAFKKSEEDKKKAAAKTAEEQTKLAEKLPEMYRQVYGDMKGYAKGYYDYSEQAISDQASLFAKAGMDSTVLAAWVTGELEKAEQKRLTDAGTAIDGIRLAEIQLKNDRISFATATSAVILNAHTGLATALGSNFYDVLTGKDTDLGDAWKTMWDGIVSTACNQAAKMLSDQAVTTALGWLNTGIGIAGDWLGNNAGSIWDWGKGILGFAEGSMNVPGDQIAQIHEGEIILPKKQSDEIRAAGATSFDDIASGYMAPVDGMSQAQLLAGWWNLVNATSPNSDGQKPFNLVQAKSYEVFNEAITAAAGGLSIGSQNNSVGLAGPDPSGHAMNMSTGPAFDSVVNDRMAGLGWDVAKSAGLGFIAGGLPGAAIMGGRTAASKIGWTMIDMVTALLGYDNDFGRAMAIDNYNSAFGGYLGVGPSGLAGGYMSLDDINGSIAAMNDPSSFGYSALGIDPSDPFGGYDASDPSGYGGMGYSSGSSLDETGYRNGLDYVPYDGFRAKLHKGERVLTAEEAKNGGGFNGVIKIYLDGKEIGGVMKVIADNVIVTRNQRGVNATQRVYS